MVHTQEPMAYAQKQESPQPSGPYQPIEDYAVIGNLYTVAFVGRNGSIDWCCIPRFDSPSVFGALLDAHKGGYFRITPLDSPTMRHKQLYIPETNVLITRFLTVDGVGEIIDFMPIKPIGSADLQQHIIRSVSVVRGSLSFEMICQPAFNYARDSHKVYLSKEGAVFNSATLCLGLASPVPVEYDGQGGVFATFTLHEGQSVHFLLESAKDRDIAPQRLSEHRFQDTFAGTVRYWRNWISQCRYQGRWR